MVQKIVLTGAPSSGKSDIFRRIQADSRFADFVFFDELARRLIDEGADMDDMRAFHLEAYRQQVAREETAEGKSFITDRGALDFLIFNAGTFDAVDSSLERELSRYTAVIHLASSATLGPGFYVADRLRPPTAGFAVEIEQVIKKVWSAHPAYNYIASEKDYEAKATRALSLIAKLAGVDRMR